MAALAVFPKGSELYIALTAFFGMTSSEALQRRVPAHIYIGTKWDLVCLWLAGLTQDGTTNKSLKLKFLPHI